jgi:dihydrofolate synthase/folylpolyglutamate synthase
MPHDAPASAFAAARGEAHADDRIVAFGSFLTVAEVMQALAARRGREPHG